LTWWHHRWSFLDEHRNVDIDLPTEHRFPHADRRQVALVRALRVAERSRASGDSFALQRQGRNSMKPRDVLAFSIALALAAPVLAQSTATAKAGTVPKAGSGQPIFMPAGDLKWTDLDPNGAPGVKVADLWGNHAKGAFGALLKLPVVVRTLVNQSNSATPASTGPPSSRREKAGRRAFPAVSASSAAVSRSPQSAVPWRTRRPASLSCR
jgi:hypothetical protein